MYLRPAKGVTPKHLEARPCRLMAPSTRRICPKNTSGGLSSRFRAKCAVTDSLVILVRTADGYVAARVAARM